MPKMPNALNAAGKDPFTPLRSSLERPTPANPAMEGASPISPTPAKPSLALPQRRRGSVADAILLAGLARCVPASPPGVTVPSFIRGSLLPLFLLKAALQPLIAAAMAAVVTAHGFHAAVDARVCGATERLYARVWRRADSY